jgi:hypothetical protein
VREFTIYVLEGNVTGGYFFHGFINTGSCRGSSGASPLKAVELST